MYNKKIPKKGEIVYWTSIHPNGDIVINKAEVIKTRWDEVNSYRITYLKKIKDIVGQSVNSFIIDYPWQLQKTLENAKRIAIIGIFKNKYSFIQKTPPWEQ